MLSFFCLSLDLFGFCCCKVLGNFLIGFGVLKSSSLWEMFRWMSETTSRNGESIGVSTCGLVKYFEIASVFVVDLTKNEKCIYLVL